VFLTGSPQPSRLTCTAIESLVPRHAGEIAFAQRPNREVQRSSAFVSALSLRYSSAIDSNSRQWASESIT